MRRERERERRENEMKVEKEREGRRRGARERKEGRDLASVYTAAQKTTLGFLRQGTCLTHCCFLVLNKTNYQGLIAQ